nr:TPA_asm: ND4L [Gammarus pulex]
MMAYMKISLSVGVICSIFSFVFNHSHLLNSLLSLEFLVLMVYWLLSLNLVSTGVGAFYAIFYIVVSVCEGVLGLSLLISGVYSHGSDYLKSYMMVKC